MIIYSVYMSCALTHLCAVFHALCVCVLVCLTSHALMGLCVRLA